jgi:CheY-like chemotaxis protein
MRLRGSASREQDVLERQVKHLTRMVDDLLDVARITRGQIELQREPIELSVVVARAMELAGPILEQRRNHLDLDVPQHGAGIDADPDRMAQVVANLVTNAAKYSEPGSRITVRGRRAGSVVCVSVKDEGIGIPSDMLASVFDAFVQQPQALERSGGGLGLGLAIVRNLVAAHGGRVRAESPGPSHGSEFIVELPATEVNAHAPEQRRSGSHEARTAQRARVLVVDDNEDAASMMRAALEQMGYLVDVASDGLSALDRAATFHPGVVLLDIGLPVIDGYEVARRLRSQEDGAPMRLIAVTGYGQETDTRRSRDAGFERHLVKPVDLDELERIIQSRPLVR